MALREIIFIGKLQDNGKQHQQLLHDVVVDVASKVLYLCPVRIDELGLFPLECWDKLRDIEDLCVIEDARLDFLESWSTERPTKGHSPRVYMNYFLTLRPSGLYPL